MRLLLTIQYLGTRYAGWQSQTNATAIQNVIEEALSTIFGTSIRIEGAGRTDAGVHARAQRAHFDAPFDIEMRGFRRGLNDLLPRDIRITDVASVADDFHCRFTTKSKTYVYKIWNDEVAGVFAAETSAHVPQPLDAALMHATAQQLLGRHDFAIFTVAGPEVSSTERTITAIDVVREGAMITITVSADGFLRSMVRRIAGSLIEIGRGKLELEAIWKVARWTAPAKGLTLWEVRY